MKCSRTSDSGLVFSMGQTGARGQVDSGVEEVQRHVVMWLLGPECSLLPSAMLLLVDISNTSEMGFRFRNRAGSFSSTTTLIGHALIVSSEIARH
jgi:hypothetical protein